MQRIFEEVQSRRGHDTLPSRPRWERWTNRITDNHFMDTFAFHAISGRDMIARFGYPACR
jgi:hypothetical protein